MDFVVPPTPFPGWMWEWAAWINQQTVVQRPTVGTAWPRELPPPPSAAA